MITWQVPPSSSSGNNCRIELAGIDLWLHATINHIFIYPSVLDIDQFKEALGCALARYPLIAGHLLLNNDHYFIEMADHSIPVSFTDNLDLSKCPFNTNVVIDKNQTSLEPYISLVQTEKLLDSSQYEPLLHVKLTRIAQSGE